MTDKQILQKEKKFAKNIIIEKCKPCPAFTKLVKKIVADINKEPRLSKLWGFNNDR